MGLKKEVLLEMQFLSKYITKLQQNYISQKHIKKKLCDKKLQGFYTNEIKIHLLVSKYLEYKDSDTIFNNVWNKGFYSVISKS